MFAIDSWCMRQGVPLARLSDCEIRNGQLWVHGIAWLTSAEDSVGPAREGFGGYAGANNGADRPENQPRPQGKKAAVLVRLSVDFSTRLDKRRPKCVRPATHFSYYSLSGCWKKVSRPERSLSGSVFIAETPRSHGDRCATFVEVYFPKTESWGFSISSTEASGA